MDVESWLFAILRQDRFRRKQFEILEETRVLDILFRLGIPPEGVAILLTNGRDAAADHRLRDGDAVSLFPLVAGG